MALIIFIFAFILSMAAVLVVYEVSQALALTDEIMRTEEGNDPDGPDIVC